MVFELTDARPKPDTTMLKKLLLSLFLLPVTVFAQQDFCGVTNNAFQDGENLDFKVWYKMGRLWVGAGQASFSVSNATMQNRPVYHIIGDGRTLKSYEWFYKVRDRYETFIDKETMLPLKFIRNVNEGGYRIYNNVTFNHRVSQAVSTNGVFSIPTCTQDVLSAIFYARSIDYNKYQKGAKIPFNMFLDDKVYPLHIRYLGKYQINTRYGTFNAIKISPMLIEGTIFKGGEKMIVWVSDDANRVPLRIESPILVGDIIVDLINYDQLRHPLTSLVKKK